MTGWRTLSTAKTWRGLPPEPVAVLCGEPAAIEAETDPTPVMGATISALNDQGAGDIPEMPDFLRRARA